VLHASFGCRVVLEIRAYVLDGNNSALMDKGPSALGDLVVVVTSSRENTDAAPDAIQNAEDS
jgi:hypothetical protein